LGCGGSGSADCGLGNIRISLHRMPGGRTNKAERRFVTFDWKDYWVGTALSADWMRPWRCRSLITVREAKTTTSLLVAHDLQFALKQRYANRGVQDAPTPRAGQSPPEIRLE